MTREGLAALLDVAMNALAEIAALPSGQAQRKAYRIYEAIRAVWQGPGPDDDAPEVEE